MTHVRDFCFVLICIFVSLLPWCFDFLGVWRPSIVICFIASILLALVSSLVDCIIRMAPPYYQTPSSRLLDRSIESYFDNLDATPFDERSNDENDYLMSSDEEQEFFFSALDSIIAESNSIDESQQEQMTNPTSEQVTKTSPEKVTKTSPGESVQEDEILNDQDLSCEDEPMHLQSKDEPKLNATFNFQDSRSDSFMFTALKELQRQTDQTDYGNLEEPEENDDPIVGSKTDFGTEYGKRDEHGDQMDQIGHCSADSGISSLNSILRESFEKFNCSSNKNLTEVRKRRFENDISSDDSMTYDVSNKLFESESKHDETYDVSNKLSESESKRDQTCDVSNKMFESESKRDQTCDVSNKMFESESNRDQTCDVSNKMFESESNRDETYQLSPTRVVVSPASSSLTSWRNHAFSSTPQNNSTTSTLRGWNEAKSHWQTLIAEGEELKKKQSKEYLVYMKTREMNRSKKPKIEQNVEIETNKNAESAEIIENVEIIENRRRSIFSIVQLFFWSILKRW